MKCKQRISPWRVRLVGLLLTASIAIAATPGFSGNGQATQLSLPQFSLAPDRLVFDAQLGVSAPTLWQDVSVSSSYYGAPIDYSATIQTGSDWLMLANRVSDATVSWGNSVSATTPGVLRVLVDLKNLTPGIYYGSVSINGTGASDTPILLPISLNVRNHPTFVLRPKTLNFSYQSGNKLYSPQPQTLSVFGNVTDFKVLVSTDVASGWLSVTPASSSTPADIVVSVNPTGLAAGTYSGTLAITAPDAVNSGITATVVLTVTSGPVPTASPSSISLQAQYGSHEPVSKGLSVDTNGDPFQISVFTGSEAWVSAQTVDPWAGARDGGTQQILHKPARLTVFADPTGLPVGTYSSVLNIGGPSSGVAVPVTLQINPNDLVIPQVADGSSWNTVITLVNTDAEPAPFTLKFWQRDGTPLFLPLVGIGSVSEYSDTIPVGGTRILHTEGTNPTISQGWAELIAQRSIGGTAIFRLQNADTDSEAVVTVAPSLGNSFLLPFDNLNNYQTGLAIVNTGVSQSSVSLNFQDENGDLIASDSITLPLHGSQAFVLQGKYPQLVNRRGTVVCHSADATLSAFGLRFSPGGTFTSFQPEVPHPPSADTVWRTIPQIADGSGWKTTFILANPGTQPIPFSIVFRDPQLGTPLALPLASIGERTEYSDVIPPGGARTFETEGNANSLVQGWAEIVSSGPVGGTVVFGETATNSEATVQIQPSIGERFVFPFDNTAGFNSALALLNGSQSKDQLATVTLRDENGQWLTTEYLQMSALTDLTFLLPDRFPSSQNLRGSIEFSGAEISALGLLFNPAGSFTSVESLRK